ncbi:hypothetical protein DITRI_Ditri17bG0066400 [Diplodiscus trichospermus]
MAYKQQIFFSLALLAAAVVLASAAGGAANPNDTAEALLKEMISSTEQAKAKGAGKDGGDLKASINAALNGYETCDYAYAQSTRPSPFIPNNANLKALGSKILELSAQAKNN